MRIVYAGPLTPGDTCALRRRALERLGHTTVGVDYLPLVARHRPLARRLQWHLRLGPLVREYQAALVAALAGGADVLWVDKGLFVGPGVLRAARRAGVRWLVHYSPDNHLLPQNVSRHFWRALPLYDAVVTTKPDNTAALLAAGARRVVLSGNAYDPELHRPLALTAAEHAAVAADVSFVGRWEPARERMLAALAALPLRLAIRGPGWERARAAAVRRAAQPGAVFGDDYVRALVGAKIGLGLLSRVAGDDITQRSIEIPACGVFMLAERTPAHLAHFAEGEEAVFFDGPGDLVRQVERWLAADAERARVAAGGRRRCLRSGYSYDDRLRVVLRALGAAA